ncbi:MAG: zinc ABC transporter substrate-binding protein [Acidaminococcaceae bacterium]|nr:zinc ABC transporter substrate-binding protein [Acidaminococcaceae bacterium]
MKKLLMLLVLCLTVVGCGDNSAKDAKLQVAASFYPMAEFAAAVGGDKVQVTTLVPDGAEPHDWEPSPKELKLLGTAKVFVYNGVVEPWADKALEALKDNKLTAVEAGKGLFTRDGIEDPHVWVSPKKAMVEVERITEALCKVDAANAEYYRGNSKKYCDSLQVLDKKLTEVAAKAPKKTFVTAHAAFGHLAADYGLKQLAVAGISPEAEPTPADMQKLINTVKSENIKYVFFETLTDPKIAALLAKEAGAETSVLDPIEGLDEDGKKAKLNYLKIMEKNIANLEKALSE